MTRRTSASRDDAAYALASTVLVPLAVARLTRLMTSDVLPERLVLSHMRAHAAGLNLEAPIAPLASVAPITQMTAAALAQQDPRLFRSPQRPPTPSPRSAVLGLLADLTWGARHDAARALTRASRKTAGFLVELADCPFCGGFWASLGTVAVTARLGRPGTRPAARTAWLVLLAALATNYVTGHLVAKLDAPAAPADDDTRLYDSAPTTGAQEL